MVRNSNCLSSKFRTHALNQASRLSTGLAMHLTIILFRCFCGIDANRSKTSGSQSAFISHASQVPLPVDHASVDTAGAVAVPC